MKIEIDAKTRIKDFQEKFSEAYPYLKVDFYKKHHGDQELSAIEDLISPEKLFSQTGKSIRPRSIDVSNHRIVADLEKSFYEIFDIAMQVSRKSGNVWIQTSKTDNRTLEQQNESGKSMSKLRGDFGSIELIE